jgi:hypothetical protein
LTGVTGYAGASPIHPLGLYTVSTTNGRLPASIAGTRQNAAASVGAPDATDPELTTVPDWATPELTTEPEALPLVTKVVPLPPTRRLALLPLPPVFEPLAPASEP